MSQIPHNVTGTSLYLRSDLESLSAMLNTADDRKREMQLKKQKEMTSAVMGASGFATTTTIACSMSVVGPCSLDSLARGSTQGDR